MTPRQPHPSLRLRASLLLTIAALVAGCGSLLPRHRRQRRPRRRPRRPPRRPRRRRRRLCRSAQVYAEIEAEISRIRGLEATDPVDPIVLDDQGIRDLAEKIFREDNPTELVAANERLLKDSACSTRTRRWTCTSSSSAVRSPASTAPTTRRCTSSHAAAISARREVDVLPRVHPCPPGPDLRYHLARH